MKLPPPLTAAELKELRAIRDGSWSGREAVRALMRALKVLEAQRQTMDEARQAIGRAYSYVEESWPTTPTGTINNQRLDMLSHLRAVGEVVTWWCR
jgi:hypothetical protein